MISYFSFSMTRELRPSLRNARTLLIVDDHSAVGRMLKRTLWKYFDTVYVTQSIAEATEVLEQNRVTHIVCDQEVGVSEMAGNRFVAFWRRRCPHIQKAVMFTGADLATVEHFPEIDAIVGKARHFSELKEALGLVEQELQR